MTKRYTNKALTEDCAELNEKLVKLYELNGTEPSRRYFFVVGARYGWSAIDLATDEDRARHCCARTLTSGKPRDCLAAAQDYVLGNV